MADEIQHGKAADEATYSHERLLADAGGFFKQPRYIVAGALAQRGVRKNLTIAEATKLIQQFKDSKSYVHPPSGSAA